MTSPRSSSAGNSEGWGGAAARSIRSASMDALASSLRQAHVPAWAEPASVGEATLGASIPEGSPEDKPAVVPFDFGVRRSPPLSFFLSCSSQMGKKGKRRRPPHSKGLGLTLLSPLQKNRKKRKATRLPPSTSKGTTQARCQGGRVRLIAWLLCGSCLHPRTYEPCRSLHCEGRAVIRDHHAAVFRRGGPWPAMQPQGRCPSARSAPPAGPKQ